MRKFAAFLVLAISLLGTWYVLSPWMAMKGLKDAAEQMDRAALAERVDFPAVSASLSQQLTQRMDFVEDALGPLGAALGDRALEESVDFIVNPEGMAVLVASGKMASPVLPGGIAPQDVEWDVERDGINQFRAVGRSANGVPMPTLVFARRGLGWRMVAVELPSTL